jgi:hypothetical protein
LDALKCLQQIGVCARGRRLLQSARLRQAAQGGLPARRLDNLKLWRKKTRAQEQQEGKRPQHPSNGMFKVS